jgi:hypothetical protein
MTLSDFDPRLLEIYAEPKHLLHFEWNGSSDVYRYALVEIIKQNKINSRNKQKEDETGLSQEEIWQKYNIVVKKD